MPTDLRARARSHEDHAGWAKKDWLAEDLNTELIARHLCMPDGTRSDGQCKTEPTKLRVFSNAVVGLLCLIPGVTSGAPLSQAQFAILASRCAPAVPEETLEAVARTESDLDPRSLRDNTTGQREQGGSLERAASEARQWLKRGDSVDIGLMQINSANLPALEMTVATAFDPCASLAGGAAVLRAAYGGGTTQAEQRVALLMALSVYNTGTPFRGILNGYVRTVLRNAGDEGELAQFPAAVPPPVVSAEPNTPPEWNVSAIGTNAEHNGAPWIIDLAPLSSTAEYRPKKNLALTFAQNSRRQGLAISQH